MKLCLFSWVFHSRIALPDEAFIAHLDGRTISIRCLTLAGAKLFSYTGENYKWLTSVKDITRTRISAHTQDQKVPFRTIYQKTDKRIFVEGVVDPIKYTRLELAFEIDDTSVIDDERKFADLKIWVSTTIQDFVDRYRLLTSDIDVPRPQLDESPVIDIFVADKYKLGPDEVVADFKAYKQVFNWINPSKTGHTKTIISTERIQELTRLFKAGAKKLFKNHFCHDGRRVNFRSSKRIAAR